MILYLICVSLLFLSVWFTYIRIRHRFWSIQPVYHYYDLYYWIVNKGIIREKLPEKNKYTNFKQIETVDFDKLKKTYINDFVVLIKLHYLRNKTVKYDPDKNNIMPYFIGHSHKCFWSFYWENDVLIDNKTNKMIETKKLIGTITSRPLNVLINNISKNENISVYYVDYLCVNKNFRNKNIAPQLIQTHEYNQAHLNAKISVSLFKREGVLTDIIPLTCYKTYYFPSHKWHKPLLIDNSITILKGDMQNMYYFYNFVNETKNKWDIMIWPEMSNMIELVKTSNIYIMMILMGTSIKSSYIYKKTACSIYNNINNKFGEVLSCIASINGTYLTSEQFVDGFKIATSSLLEKCETCKYCSIENISDNDVIISNINIKTPSIIQNLTAYFFYNFAYAPFQSNKCLILN
jgi:hypothetical protein